MFFLSEVIVSVNRRGKDIKVTLASLGLHAGGLNVRNIEKRYFHILTFSYTFHRILLWIQGFGFIGLQLHTCFINFGLVAFRENNFSWNPCFEPNPPCSKLFAFKYLYCKSKSHSPATNYCTRLREVKKRIALGSVGIFSFVNVILNDFSLLYYLNFNL